ncbi:hypothetical protein J1N35_028385 [Gossypium stocksii]|uniref:MULE transposase domain-containing protein n=1 Tax=Gossypium stocksii TaxID=47602 RepID=A0A9D3ZS24_9ROSI|nr:hypothetical protein J1N35_028385 [Gossypium stocksii]
MSSSDVPGSDTSERVSLDGINMDGIEVDELYDSDDFGRLDSAHESDSDGQNWPEFNLENDMSNLRLKVGMLFKSKDNLKEVAEQYVSLTKCKRAKLRALELIERSHKARYEKIYEYFLEACKDGYRAGCRRIVSLDGCFLKGYYGGYLLAAVRIDANNGIYPLAYAAVESENQALWLWFLELLAIDLEIKLTDLLWKAARVNTTREFNAMDELRKTNQHSYDWLKEKNPTNWSRSHFSIKSHSNMLVNNLSKSFNKQFTNHLYCLLTDDTGRRGKPILTMMETIRTKIMLLIVKKKEEANK